MKKVLGFLRFQMRVEAKQGKVVETKVWQLMQMV